MDYFNIIFIGEKIIYQICNLRNLVVTDRSVENGYWIVILD